MRNRHTTVARVAVALPISRRSFSSQHRSMRQTSWAAGSKKQAATWRSTTRVRRAAPNVRLITPISPWY